MKPQRSAGKVTYRKVCQPLAPIVAAAAGLALGFPILKLRGVPLFPPKVFRLLGGNQTLTDTFSYTISDGHGGTSTTQVTVTIHGQNDNPVANNDTATATEAGGTNNGTAGTNISNFNVRTGVGAG